MSHPVSGYIMVLNEERSVGAALRSLNTYVDDLVIMDCGSTDKTQDIIKEFIKDKPNARFEISPQNADRYSIGWSEPKRRNACIEKCLHDWVLTLDGDETLDDLPSDYFSEMDVPLYFGTINAVNFTQYIVKGYSSGKWHNWYPDYHVRYFPKTHRYLDVPLHGWVCAPNGKATLNFSKKAEADIWHWHALVKNPRYNNLMHTTKGVIAAPFFKPLPSNVPAYPILPLISGELLCDPDGPEL